MPTMARNSIETSNLWRAKVVQKMVQDNELSSNSSIVVFICSIDAFCVFKTFENSESENHFALFSNYIFSIELGLSC